MRAPAPALRPPREPLDLLAEVIVRTGSSDREETTQALLERLAVEPDDAVLELGVGNGRLLAAVAARVPRGSVSGVDFSERMLRHARRRCGHFIAGGRVRLVRAESSQRAPFEDARFDKLYGIHVPYFWREPARDVDEARRVLRPGGRLVLGYWPSEDGPAERARRGKRACSSVSGLEGLLRASGFTGVHTEHERDGGHTVAWTTAQC